MLTRGGGRAGAAAAAGDGDSRLLAWYVTCLWGFAGVGACGSRQKTKALGGTGYKAT
jgi:hypothetical protein